MKSRQESFTDKGVHSREKSRECDAIFYGQNLLTY